jgi:hypothetical protein
VQLRFKTGLTGAEYVTAKAWRLASLPHCPEHGPDSNCDFHRNGTYARKTPAGTRIACWYCRDARRTWSLLPDHLAARLPGTLREVEEVVVSVEQAKSLARQAQELRKMIMPPGAVRWVYRRLTRVRQLLPRVIELLPQLLRECMPTIASVREHLGCDCVLLKLREAAADHLQELRPPLGFKPQPYAREGRKSRFQERTGLDPPPQSA